MERFTVDQNRRFRANRERQEVLNAELARREKILYNYLNSTRVKKLKRDVQKALDDVNENIRRESSSASHVESRGNPVSVDGELRYGYKDDPKSW